MALRNVGIKPTFDDWYRYVSIIDPAEILEMWSTSRNGKKTHHQKLLQLKDAWYWKSFVSFNWNPWWKTGLVLHIPEWDLSVLR